MDAWREWLNALSAELDALACSDAPIETKKTILDLLKWSMVRYSATLQQAIYEKHAGRPRERTGGTRSRQHCHQPPKIWNWFQH
jgi:hypothetical protein